MAYATTDRRRSRLEVWVWLDGSAAPENRVTGPARDLASAMSAVVLQHAATEDTGSSGVDAWSRLEEVGAPTTIACGELDVPYLLDHCEQLLARIPGAPSAALPGTAHLYYLERPDVVAGAITAAI